MPRNKIIPYYIRDVNVCSDYSDGDASHAVLYIDRKMYKLIKKAQMFVIKTKSYEVTTFDYSPDFMDYPEGCKTTDNLTLEDLTPNETMNVDALRLVVTQDNVHWEGYLKHSDPSVVVYTHYIDISEIDHNFETLDKPIDELPLFINHCKFESSKRIATERLKHGT